MRREDKIRCLPIWRQVRAGQLRFDGGAFALSEWCPRGRAAREQTVSVNPRERCGRIRRAMRGGRLTAGFARVSAQGVLSLASANNCERWRRIGRLFRVLSQSSAAGCGETGKADSLAGPSVWRAGRARRRVLSLIPQTGLPTGSGSLSDPCRGGGRFRYPPCRNRAGFRGRRQAPWRRCDRGGGR